MVAELTDAVAEQHPRRLAEQAVTRWIITREPIDVAIAAEIELGAWKSSPRPQRGQQGFPQPGP
ncbi:hypothetical protein [Pseudonocardia lacus]|uniref:hypothetical protein n=1 Tax=Pseudonocardia lacus TaxID=2835865 RepID=UPI001BDD0060|nr:hypothetical protein [Pseudonocardia lacus]